MQGLWHLNVLLEMGREENVLCSCFNKAQRMTGLWYFNVLLGTGRGNDVMCSCFGEHQSMASLGGSHNRKRERCDCCH